MNYQQLYLTVAEQVSRQVTQSYSTSFYWAIQQLDKSIRQPIYNIYGMVRIADEIVDTFGEKDNVRDIFENFEKELWLTIQQQYSTNLILHSFQKTYHEFHLEKEHIEAFLTSMKMDLYQQVFTEKELKTYIYGSAEVVGLMCLKIFCKGDEYSYLTQKEYAQFLGSFFQKINFLRDISTDFQERKRMYFSLDTLAQLEAKRATIICDMKEDMEKAKKGICNLPSASKNGVYLAYLYYKRLLQKIEQTSSKDLIEKRISISMLEKISILVLCRIRTMLGML